MYRVHRLHTRKHGPKMVWIRRVQVGIYDKVCYVDRRQSWLTGVTCDAIYVCQVA